VDWFPHPGPQTEFCERGEFEILFGGAAGPGKTDCLIMEAARYVSVSGYRAVIFRRTFPQLQEIIDRCWKWYPTFGGEYRAGEHRWYFEAEGGGIATIQLSHMQHENNKYDHQGKEYHFIGLDELTQFLESQYLYLLSRVRVPPPGVQLRVRATTNPGGVGHVWVKTRFVDVAPPLETYIDPATGQSRVFVPAKIYDNPTLVERDPLYVRRLEALPEVERKRLLHGEWDVFEGQAFPELLQVVHGCDEFDIPPEWEKFMAFDWGYSKPWVALWFAMDFDGVMYLYRELYGCKEGEPDTGLRQTNDEICKAIIKVEREKVRYRVADPACWSPTKIKGSNKHFGPSFVEDAGHHGLFFSKADNDRLRGRQQCHMRFALEQKTEPDGTIVEETPRFVAFNSAKHWWRTMTQLYEHGKNPEEIDTDQEDHHYDTTRYAFMSRPIIPKRINKAPPGSFKAERDKLIRAKRYARAHGVSLAAAYGMVR
jgi:hypothetical protein